ncbi:MAG: RNA-binding protein [Chitinophagaceae bacterium]|nr:RNA-binding protein [Chitinophagaceae bacterium]
MIKPGEYNTLKVLRIVAIGAYLDDGAEGILLPKRYLPAGTKTGDELEVFIYHDSENRLIATTQQPLGAAGDIVMMEVVAVTPQGAFMDWGLQKDIFVPKSKQRSRMYVGERYLVKIYVDEQTGRVAASEKFDDSLSNEHLTVKEMERVNLVVYRPTDIGYLVIINNKHTGVLHYNEVFRELQPGDRLSGFIKNITEENKIDVVAGKPGYEKVTDEAGKILNLLEDNSGYLPYNDKSDPDDIYRVFGMSKKAFKMTVGSLYKQRKIRFTQTGIQQTNPEG